MIGKVLVVDDEVGIRFFTSYGLTQAGWQVHEVESGEAALAWLENNTCDVILLDLNMPGIDGHEVMATVKQSNPEIIIIIMTAYATVNSAIDAVRQGAFDYLQKPCNLEDITACTSKAMAEKAKQDQQRQLVQQAAATKTSGVQATLPPPIKSGSLIIDLGSHTVSLKGKQLSLTPTEFSLLKILSGSVGQPVSIDNLIKEGLGYQTSDPQAQETLRVHISRLRRKLGRNYIVTIRGGGYTLANIPSV